MSLLIFLCGVVAAARRRQLLEHDLHYGLDLWNERFVTRAATVFEGKDHFHRRLFEHEVGLDDGQLQSFMVNLQSGIDPEADLRARLETRARGDPHLEPRPRPRAQTFSSPPPRVPVTIDRVVNKDLLMHGTREHADALRGQPEVRKVVPLLPELKVTPHFEALLPAAPANGTVSLNVRLTTYERHEHLRPAGAELAGRLTRALRARCAASWRSRPSCNLPAGRLMTVEAHLERLAVVAPVAPQDAVAVAEALAQEPEVMWVEPHQEFRVFNNDGVSTTQSGTAGFNGGRADTAGTTPIWEMGLHGEGEIIGVGDSGLDTGHCFFEEATGGAAADQTYGPNHRKVVAYRAYADGVATGTSDHGTHVVGSILGSSSTPGAAGANEGGAAYAAKVSFTDIGPGDAPGLQVPNDLANNFFNVDYDNGARIHSNSWGANVNAYTTSTVGVDQASYEMDDLVILFAAGNSGNADLTPSIGAPATCKNCITVGATENDNSNRAVGVNFTHRALAPHPAHPAHPRPRPRPHPHLHPCPRLCPQDGEMALFSSTGLAVGGRIKPDVTAPGFLISSSNSNSAGDCPIVEMAGTSMATPITAGDVALIRQYLREGFYPSGERGKDLGGNNFEGGRIPSGALMKAMTIAAGQKMPGNFRNVDLEDPGDTGMNGKVYPNQYEGYGRVQLNQVLFAKVEAGEDTPGQSAGDRLFIVDGETLATGGEIVYDVATRGDTDGFGAEIKVVLVWTDPPGEPISANPLVNNLDLLVQANGVTFNGNMGPTADTVNNVEAVKITDAASGVVTVTVKGTSVVGGDGPQKFALVITGPLAMTSPPPAARPPPPPRPPDAPFDPSALGDAVALGISIPLLLVALVSAFAFIFKRVAKKGGAVELKALPAGWKMLIDPSSGSPFYTNEATGERTWEAPSSGDSNLPPGWTAQAEDCVHASHALHVHCMCSAAPRVHCMCMRMHSNTCRSSQQLTDLLTPY